MPVFGFVRGGAGQPGGRWVGLGALVALQMLFAAPVGSQALKGMALVVGQSDYASLPDLANTGRDAEAIERLLDDLGFDASGSTDRDARRLARDLDGFLDDAEDADVAVLYYAGHAIEIGGENYLVPTDADASSPEALSETLISLTDYVGELRRRAKVTIVLLDACRDNPFPPGTMVRVGAAAPVPVGDTGLGTRGAASLSVSAPDTEDGLGTVIAFAAEPGKVALDGEPGGNSPYATAILRHLSAMSGAEFGTVMRMVAEEVYLKTGGRQRPWTNESLRRLLYFGGTVAEPTGDEGDILKERRQLLLTIAALPDFERGQVERVAAQGGVPMDAVYGMLTALGGAAPRDPAKLEEVLRAETERFARILAEREAVASPDPEILRLTALADGAEREGLLAKSLQLRERAKVRFLEVETSLEQQERALRQRFVEGAAVFARSAETKTLAFDHAGAAQDYAEAFARVEARDDRMAWRYKQAEMAALTDHGNYKGDNAALERAIEAGRQALRFADDLGDRDDWAMTQNSIGVALWFLGERESGTARLEEAVAVYRAILEQRTRDSVPLQWATTQNSLANALMTLGERESGTTRLEEAVGVYRAALEEWTRERVPLRWAMTQNNLGNVLRILGQRERGTARLGEAVAAFRAALEEQTRERAPLDWAMTQDNLGNALRVLGERESGTARLEEAVEAYRAALQVRTRERVPLQWARTQNNLGNALATLGNRESGTARLEEAVAAYRAALQEHTRERVPLDWAATQSNLGIALQDLGGREAGTARLEEAVAAHRAALQEWARESVPLDWATAQNNLGNALVVLGGREAGSTRLEEAVAAYRAALGERTRERVPLEWAMTQNNLGAVLRVLGEREAGTARLEESVAAYRAALQERIRERVPLDWAATQHNLGVALVVLGGREAGTARLEEAVDAYRAALQEWTHERVPLQWAAAQTNLGTALQTLGERVAGKEGARYWEDAVAAWRNAALVHTREQQSGTWATLQNAIGYRLALIGERESDPSRFREAIPTLRAALAVQTELKSAAVPFTADSLCRALLGDGAARKDRAALVEAKQLCESAMVDENASSAETAANLVRIEEALAALP